MDGSTAIGGLGNSAAFTVAVTPERAAAAPPAHQQRADAVAPAATPAAQAAPASPATPATPAVAYAPSPAPAVERANNAHLPAALAYAPSSVPAAQRPGHFDVRA